ncbi:MAG: PEP-CTERM sorting domain-containing protein [Pirellulaceae bacterium]|nr:PEP-CTERM sorting domain-containing protein [Pirellulaceae bacterium]
MILRNAFLAAGLAAMLLAPKSASAALLTFFNKATYDAQLVTSGLIDQNFTNFEAEATGSRGLAFTAAGIGFAGSAATPLRVDSTTLSGGFTPSGTNFLGFDDPIVSDFTGGDTFDLVLPAGTRAVKLTMSSPTDLSIVPSFGRLSVTSGINTTSADTVAANAQLISGATNGYFLGIVDTTSAFTGATVSFSGQGIFRVDDVGVAAVPEPSSLGLAAVAGLVGFARRRRRSL